MERSADWMDQARGDWEHAQSDLERGFDDAHARVRRTLNLPRLEAHLYTEEAYRSLQGTLERMVADGIPTCPRTIVNA